MTLRILCNQCGKKIIIDAAFAGGICRCPYCKSLVKVWDKLAGSASRQQQQRPQRPVEPQVKIEAFSSPSFTQQTKVPQQAVVDQAIPLATRPKLAIYIVVAAVVAIAMAAGIAAIVLLHFSSR